jgi:hypothetical protein
MQMCNKYFARQISGKILLDKTSHEVKFDGHAIYNLHYYNCFQLKFLLPAVEPPAIKNPSFKND